MKNLIRSIAVLILSFGLPVSVFCQNDSITFVSAKWQTEKVARGITWKKFLFQGTLFNSNQSINIIEGRQGKNVFFTIGYNEKLLRPTSEFGQEANAIAALNGTFFDMKEGGSVDFVKAGGKIIHSNRLRNDARTVHQKAAIAIKNGKFKITKWNGEPDWELKMPDDDIMVSGPLLIFNGKNEAIDSSSFSRTRHPRSAVVTTTSGRVLLITVDGRHENAVGMSLYELQKIMRWLEACEGLNLDGGGSTTLWIYNQPDNGVVNYPSDNKKWDHFGERKVANVLLLKKR